MLPQTSLQTLFGFRQVTNNILLLFQNPVEDTILQLFFYLLLFSLLFIEFRKTETGRD